MILNLFSVFLVGFMAHFMVIVFILLGLFGNKIKVYTEKLLENQSLSFYIIYFLVVVVYLTYIQFNVVYCDDVSISTSINNVEVTVSGGILNNLFQNVGTVSVYVASMRLVSALLAKQKLSALPKIGAITLGSTGLTFGYKFVNNTFAGSSDNVRSLKFSLGDVKIQTPNSSPEATNSILNKFFNLQGVKIETTIPLEAKNFRITGTQEQNSEILNQVANQDLDWTQESNLADLFINSPLESSENSFLVMLVDFLTNSMYLQYISLYFATLATIIFTCKIIIDNNINLEFTKKFIFGKFIYFGITKYISFWRGSANFWIYFALFFNWFFILISSVGTHRAIINISSNFLN